MSQIIKSDPDFYLQFWHIAALFYVILLFLSVILNSFNSHFSKTLIGKVIASPVFFLLTSALAIFILRLPTLLLPEQNMDESQWIANAATLLNGAVLWKDVNGFTSGPLLFMPLTLMYYLLDGLNYANIRLFGMLITIIPSVLIIYIVIKNFFDQKNAALFTLPVVLFFSFSFTRDFIAYESELVPMLLFSIALYFFFAWQLKKTNAPLLFLGIIIGLFPYAKLQALPIGFAIFVCVAYEMFNETDTGLSKKISRFIILTSGAVFPSLLLLLYLIRKNALNDFYNQYLLQNIDYTQTGLSYHLTGIYKIFIPVIIAKETPEAGWFFGFGFLFFFLLSYLFYKNRTRINSACKKKTVYLFFIFIAAYFSVCMPGSCFYHYETLLLIPFLIFIVSLASSTFTFTTEMPLLKKSIQFIVVLILLTPLLFSFFVGNKGIEFVKTGGSYTLSRVSKEIIKYTMPNEKLAVWGWNNKFYVETALTQGTPGVNSFYETHSAINNDFGKLMKYIEELKKNQPVVFLDAALPVFVGFKIQHNLSHENFPALNQFINSSYTLVATINQKKIYVLNERLMKMGLL